MGPPAPREVCGGSRTSTSVQLPGCVSSPFCVTFHVNTLGDASQMQDESAIGRQQRSTETQSPMTFQDVWARVHTRCRHSTKHTQVCTHRVQTRTHTPNPCVR